MSGHRSIETSHRNKPVCRSVKNDPESRSWQPGGMKGLNDWGSTIPIAAKR
jgi:hypothetical protein